MHHLEYRSASHVSFVICDSPFPRIGFSESNHGHVFGFHFCLDVENTDFAVERASDGRLFAIFPLLVVCTNARP